MARPRLISKKRCAGCQLCAIICSIQHLKEINPKKATLNVKEKFFSEDLYELQVCVQCGICAKKCPEGCIIRDARGVYVIEDPSKCSQCGECIEVCPFHVLKSNGDNQVLKCNLCEECVKICPYNNLEVKE